MFHCSSRERDFCKRGSNDTSSCSESSSQCENYIGKFVGIPLTDDDRRKVLFNCWSPLSGFSFPYVTVGVQNRSFQRQCLNEFTWLAYSDIYNGAFCKWCVVFAPQTVSRSQGRTQGGGVGLTPPIEFAMLQKRQYLCKGVCVCFRTFFACLMST